MGTERLEAFSDGVFAIAITLLVLEIQVPKGEHGLASELLDLWPSYAAYVVSFATIGIIWVNHHYQFERTTEVDRPLLYLNLLLLMVVAFIPFPTAVIAEHLDGGEPEHTAAAFYAATLLVMSLTFFGISEYTRRRGLIEASLPRRLLLALRKRGRVGALGYMLAIAVAFWNAPASVAICGAIAAFYVFPGRQVTRIRAELEQQGKVAPEVD